MVKETPYIITPKGGWRVQNGMIMDVEGNISNSEGKSYLLVATPEQARKYRDENANPISSLEYITP